MTKEAVDPHSQSTMLGSVPGFAWHFDSDSFLFGHISFLTFYFCASSNNDIPMTYNYASLTLAHNHHTPEDVLLGLAHHPWFYVRHEVARNPNTPKEVLRLLADDRVYLVREAVARNPNTPKEVLRLLADDKDFQVRERVARNPRTPKEALRQLAGDKVWQVRHSVAFNPSTPKEVLRQLAEHAAAYRFNAQTTLDKLNTRDAIETSKDVIFILKGANLRTSPRTSRCTLAKIPRQPRNQTKTGTPIVKRSSSTRPRSRTKSSSSE